MKIFKFFVLILILSVFVFSNLPFAGAEGTKIGYINLGKTFDEYKKTQEYEKSLEKKRDQKEKDRKKLVDEIKNLKEEIALLSNKGKSEKQPVIDEKIRNLQEFDETTRTELRQERDEMVKIIFGEIDKVIQDYGRKNGYTVILNDRVLIYGDEAIDVTQELIDIINKK